MRSLLEISKSGLKSAERSLSVTSNNIVNADTPGYTRQRLEKSPVGMQMTGYNTGLGVSVTGLTRMRNEMNDVLMNQKQQDMSFLESKTKIYEQLEAVMATDSENDLDLTISNLLDGFSELASNPQDMSVRRSLLSAAERLSVKFGDLNLNVERLSELTLESADKTVGSVNDLLKEIHILNKSVEQGNAAGQPDNNSLDLRVRKLEELSQLINFDSQISENGAVELRVGGVTILDAEKAHKITPQVDDIRREYILRVDSGKTLNVSSGQLGAEVEMYSKNIPQLIERLDSLAGSIVEEVNNIHSQGFGLNDDSSRNFFDPEGTSASEIKVNQNLLSSPSNIAASSASSEAGNGEIAARIAEIRNEKLIDGRKLIDYSVDLISEPGVNVKSMQSQIEARDSEIQMLMTQQEREAGVNIDEELSLMIQYQNAYQGAAKVMSAAQNMYDTLIGILR